jgi:hypothetical protein
MENNKYGYPFYWIVAFAGVFQASYAMMAGAWYLYLNVSIVAAVGLILAVFVLFTIIASTI